MQTLWYNTVLLTAGLVLTLLLCTAPLATADAVLAQLGADLTATPLDDAALDSQRAAGTLGFLQNLIATLPSGNTVVAHVNGRRFESHSSTSSVSINESVGGTTVRLFAGSGVFAARVFSRTR